ARDIREALGRDLGRSDRRHPHGYVAPRSPQLRHRLVPRRPPVFLRPACPLQSARLLTAQPHPSIPAPDGAAAGGGVGIQGEPRRCALRPPGAAAASRRPRRRRTRWPHAHTDARQPRSATGADAQLEQLRHATETLLTSEGWQRWLRTRSRFHRYSLRNTLLIAFQCPQATHVAGFRKWLELGRCVRKGEKAIRIFAPVRYRRPDADQTDPDEPHEQLVGFKLAAVFDVSQTEPLPGVEP